MLHAGSTNKNGFKALIAAEYSGVNVERVKNFEMGVSNRTPKFYEMNPIGKVGGFYFIVYVDKFNLLKICLVCFIYLNFNVSLCVCRFLCWKHPMAMFLRVMPLPATVRLGFKFLNLYSNACILKVCYV